MKITAAIISDEHHVLLIEYKPTWWRKLLRLPLKKHYLSSGPLGFWFLKKTDGSLKKAGPIADLLCDIRWTSGMQRQRLTALSQ